MLDGYCDVERAAYLSSVSVIVQILVGVRVWHACRVASYNVEVGSCWHSSLGVPLHLSLHHTAITCKQQLDTDRSYNIIFIIAHRYV